MTIHDLTLLDPTSWRRSLVVLLVLVDSVHHDWSEGLNQTLDWPSSGITQGTNSVALNFLCQLENHVDFFLSGLTGDESVHHLQQPSGSLSTWGTLTTRLVLVESGKTLDSSDNVGLLVHDNDGGSTQTGTNILQGIVIHQNVLTNVLSHDRDGGTTWDDTQQVVPSAFNTTTVLLQQLLQRNGHFFLNSTWLIDVTGDTEQFGSGVSLTTKACEPVTTSSQNGWSNSNGLDIGNSGWSTEQTNTGREWRLQSWLTGLTLYGLNERGLLTTNVSTHTSVDVDIKVVTGATSVLTNQASLVSLVDGLLQHNGFVIELTTDVNVGGSSVHTSTSQQTALNQLVRVLSDDLTILTGTRLTLIGINDQVTRTWVLVPSWRVHERPLETRWETSASTASQAGFLHLVDDPLVTLQDDLFCFVPITHFLGALQVVAVSSVYVLEDSVSVLQTTVNPVRVQRSICSGGKTSGGLRRVSQVAKHRCPSMTRLLVFGVASRWEVKGSVPSSNSAATIGWRDWRRGDGIERLKFAERKK
ncbi:hypothetical protein PUMCH_000980 [Australozyma saopauloensis]|uniref:Uncharacterized protein n=1 Tax=Australozyma saopauloensis TaxID=291208 RepID=A0AAX4H5H1_9ASCO|nr:hypothetical protein PUMCH_000980 [[Candida] saopauloensis]